jgi:ATP-binding cassette subfamily B protein RaxB
MGDEKHSLSASNTLALLGLQLGWARSLPIFLQTEATECGLACLAMIAKYHGHDVDLVGLRQRHPTNARGVTLPHLMKLAGHLQLTARPLRLDLEHVGSLRLPSILHWDLKHFVVLERVRRRHVVVHDPAQGVRKLSIAELSRHFTGVALELTPAPDFRPVAAKQSISIRAIAGRIRGLGTAMAHILVLALCLEVLGLIAPFYVQLVLDHVLVSFDRSLLSVLAIGFCCIAMLNSLFGAARSWAITRLSALVNVQWAANLFAHLMKLPLAWFGKRHVGDVVSRFSSIQSIQKTLTTQFIGTLIDGVMSVATVAVMGIYAPTLAAIVLSLFAAYVVIRVLVFNPLKRANEEQIAFSAYQQSELLESIRGVMPIKLAGKSAERLARYCNAAVSTANREIVIQRFTIACTLASQWAFGLGRIAVIWLGASNVLDGNLSAGMLIAFIAYADQFIARATSLVDKGMEFRMLKLHTERVADIALTEPEPITVDGSYSPVSNAGIELVDVSFRYSEDEPWILQNCNLSLIAGSSVAITGASGCGKSTLAKIILGLLRPVSGEVRFGGQSIEKIGLGTYRQLIGAVMQDDQLFAGSLFDNISFFDPEATMSRVIEAAQLAAMHDDIMQMPMRYQTPVGDMGSSLSGGQKQRVILARALYRQPKLLVLDEATSHLDIIREREVNASIRQLNVTRVIIAHRAETILSADRVIVLEGGKTELVEASSTQSINATPGHSGDLLVQEKLV